MHLQVATLAQHLMFIFYEKQYTLITITRGVARNLFWGGIEVFGEV